MSEPEQLDSGPSRPPGRPVWVLAAVLVVAVGIGLVWDQQRSDQTAPAPVPSPTATRPTTSPRASTPPPGISPSPAATPSPSAPVTFWPEGVGEDEPLAAGLPAGMLYARSSGTLYAVDVRIGAIIVTPIRMATTDAVSMVPLSGGVALRPWDDTAGLLVRDGQTPVDLPGQLKTARELLPGPPGRLWVLTQDDNAPYNATATLVDERGRRAGPGLTSTGGYTSDGAGGLLLSDVGGVWQVHPQPVRRVTGGSITSVGADHYQLLDCNDRHRCAESLLDRRTGRRTPLSPRERSFGNSALSPDGRFLASVVGSGSDGGPWTTIRRVTDNELLQKQSEPPNPATSQPGSIAWLSARWLVSINDGRLTLYDTTKNKVHTPDLPADNLLQLTWRLN